MKSEPLFSRSMAANGLPPFTVSGGPFSQPQQMGWHITTEDGFTVAVACDSYLVDRLDKLEALARLLARCDAAYHLGERKDQGYLECQDEEWAALRAAINDLGIDND